MPLVLSYLPKHADQVLVAVNPNAGARSGQANVSQVAALLEQEGYKVRAVSDLDAIARQAEEAHAEGRLRAVVAAGGDGTAAEIVNRTSPGIPLAILPLGTENLLAKHLEIVRSPEGVARMIADGAMVRLDAAKAIRNNAAQAGSRIFLLMAGCGFDAEVVRRLHADRRGHVRHWTYAKPIFDSVRSYGYPELRIYFEEHSGIAIREPVRVINARWAFVVNLPRYAARLRLAPQALGTDGLLDVCTFRHGTLWQALRYLAFVVLGRQACLPDCSNARVTRVRIESDLPVPYQLDGDPGGFLPLTIEVLPERLTLIVPRRWALANGFEEGSGVGREGSGVRVQGSGRKGGDG